MHKWNSDGGKDGGLYQYNYKGLPYQLVEWNKKDLFEQKWNILERETRQLAIDKDKFEREKLIYKDKVYREARRSMSNAENVKIFFKGVEDTTSLKKRYKALLKIYHPDNMHGDKELLQAINTEYERLSRFYY